VPPARVLTLACGGVNELQVAIALERTEPGYNNDELTELNQPALTLNGTLLLIEHRTV
jgi:hypothetical protein